MKKVIILLAALFCASSFNVFSQMTDDQVVSYVKSAANSGKSQAEITRELLARGVTVEQANRLKEKYQDGSLSGEGSEDTGYTSTRNPRQNQTVSKNSGSRDRNSNTRNSNDRYDRISRQGQNPDDEYISPNGQMDQYDNRYDNQDMRDGQDMDAREIFGHSIFSSATGEISFEPNLNIATPENYKLGPGDEVIIDIWGFNEASLKQVISPEGKITVSQIGPVFLSGLTIKEATSKIRRVLSQKYSGIDGTDSDVSVSLGSLRTIQVNVMGDVKAPGAYRLSSFSTVFTALYSAGGVTGTGSLRDIQIFRGSKKFKSVDLYEYIFKGSTSGDFRLEDGDVIMVPAYVNLVTVEGGVKRPLKYEMKNGETVANLIEYAGGFTGEAFTGSVSVDRNLGNERQILTSSKESGYDVALADGDVVTVGVNVQYYTNDLEILGAVVNPGSYELGRIKTLKQLIEYAGGLKEDAFLARTVIRRVNEDRSYSTLSVNLNAIMKDNASDINLQRGDHVLIPGIFDIQQRGILTINGFVLNPGSFVFMENTTVEDLIILAGGLTDGASLAKVEVSRRIDDPMGTAEADVIGETFTFSIKEGLAVDGADSFYLKAYDVVSVRKSPTYQEQQFVSIDGEVNFPGYYVLQTRGERLSSVVNRAGGLTPRAYLHGATLTRTRTQEEMKAILSANEIALQTISSQKDSLKLSKIASTYQIAVDYDKAIANPGSDYDIVLREGDVLTIPLNSNIISIKGEVLFPNTVLFEPGKSIEYFINKAGGYTEKARRSKVFVTYQNGTASRGSGAPLEPGCEIVVPSKPDRRQMTASEILSIGTSTTSLATMVVTLLNLIKK